MPRGGRLAHFVNDRRPPEPLAARLLTTALPPMAAGAVLAVSAHHLRRRWLLAAVALLAVAPAAWVAVEFASSSKNVGFAVSWAIRRQAAFALAAFAGGAAGVLLARPTLRGLARALLPPSIRGAIGFLWTSDGRAVPR